MSSARSVKIGALPFGGGAPIRVESMLKSRLDDVDGCLKELGELGSKGCELVRIAFPDIKLAASLKEIVDRTTVAVMADIHFDHRLAISAIESGMRAIRINPGNMSGEAGLASVIDAARSNAAVIRIGANGGSINRDQLERAGGDRAAALVLAVDEQLRTLTDRGFEDVIISAKSSSVPETVAANLMLAQKYDLPMHIGITEAGVGRDGIIKGAAGIGSMLLQGIGDTIRVSLTGPSITEVEVGWSILRALELRQNGTNFISCPGCGRRRVDVLTLADDVKSCIPDDLPDGLSIAVMGCEVNGPREAAGADLGVAGTKEGFVIFRHGEAVATGKSDQLKEAVQRELEQLRKSL